MNAPAIRIEGLSKQYVVGTAHPHGTLYEVLSNLFKRGEPGAEKQFWALRDVDAQIAPGEVVGVVGRNGAGKSTLLKILGRITAPTRGRVTIRGRVASLLEVGTGFHPELTGRENIFLNGTILGMKRPEIQRKLDAIVDFSGIEKFIDTPVKRYSSGMYVRLAFAVAAHVEADVLLVDEVLAVGDAQFQKKCLGKLEDIRGSGRTIFFVSHNAAAVRKLCSSALLLQSGRVAFHGTVGDTLSAYAKELQAAATMPLDAQARRGGNGKARFVDYWLEDLHGRRIANAVEAQPVRVCLAYESTIHDEHTFAAFDLRDENGDLLASSNTNDWGGHPLPISPGRGVFVCELPMLSLRAGRYMGNLFMSSGLDILDWLEAAITIEVMPDEQLHHERFEPDAVFLMRSEWHSRREGTA